MNRTLSITTPSGAERTVTLEGAPDNCPRCHAHVVPRYLITVARSTEVDAPVESAFQCTSQRCSRLYIARYNLRLRPGTGRHATYSLGALAPLDPAPVELPDLVSELSPVFVETYAQSASAEAYGLLQLTGIGLRKALEFLVKDFAIKENPTEAERIMSMPLAACIKEFVVDQTVKEVARRAAWLGNDETHYLRRCEDRDVNDLKILIRLTVNGIENVLLARRYVEEMPDGAS